MKKMYRTEVVYSAKLTGGEISTGKITVDGGMIDGISFYKSALDAVEAIHGMVDFFNRFEATTVEIVGATPL